MTFMEQVFALFATISVIGAAITYWYTHRRH